ncbi:Pol protein [Phytophthora palmivora]|uniref:Pol protein n=1 Tax=Phytophthora palmivora TaxID=4796 RepID=A0A2P4XNB1_9STRA|nr:Pol protein [Phytophthora palmivora]
MVPVQLKALTEVSALPNLEELPAKKFLAEPEIPPEDVNCSSVLDKKSWKCSRSSVIHSWVLGFSRTRRIPLVNGLSDEMSKYPLSQLPPDWGVQPKIDFVYGTKYCVMYLTNSAIFTCKVKSG